MFKETNSNKALMRRMYEEMWNAHQPQAASQLFDQPAGVEQFVTGFLDSFPDLIHTIEGMIADGDIVVTRFSARGTHTGRWMNLAPTGRAVHYTGITWARIHAGRIAEHHTEWDRAGLIEQLS